jgi:hypothetical protein
MSGAEVGLPDALERAASALTSDAEAIRPANGDPFQLAALLDAEAAVRVLTWLLCNEPAAGEELASAWAEDADGAGQAVLGVDAGALPKSARKPLRRVLHRLRSQGLSVPEAAPQGEIVAKLPTLDESLHEGRVSALDPRGARVVYLALDHPSGGARLFEIVIDDDQGVLEFEVYNTGRSRVRRFLRDFERAGGRLPGADAPEASIRALIHRSLSAHPDARPLPRGFSEWRSRLAEGRADAPSPGALARAELSDAAAPADALDRVSGWVKEGVLGPWPAAQDRLTPIAERIAESGKSTLVVSGATRREQLEGAIDAALIEIFDEGFAETTALRFEESAYLLWKADRAEDARAALAAADTFRGGSPATNPVARSLLEVLFAPVLRAARGDAAEDGGDAPSPVVEA